MESLAKAAAAKDSREAHEKMSTANTSPNFGCHFDHEVDDATYAFVLSRVAATTEGKVLRETLAQMMAKNKADPTVTADLLKAAGWETAIAPLKPGRVSVRRGDFGEVLAVEAGEALDGLVVPIRKLRYQIDPNQTLPGADIVGMAINDDRTINHLEFIESKFRSAPSADIACEAHEQLADDRNASYATTVNFLAHRLSEVDGEVYSEFIAFLKDRNIKDSYHTVAITIDATNHKQMSGIADNLNNLPTLLSKLRLRFFTLPMVVQLIDDVYEALTWDVVEDD